jgi:hypothetical protein
MSALVQNTLLYGVMPVWILAGFADYLCHRRARIERTSGVREASLHLLQFAEAGVPVLAGLLCEINALVLLTMIGGFVLHQVTAMLDVRLANATRRVSPIEQHVHSFLEMIPLMALVLVVLLHWPAFLSLFGRGPASFALHLKQPSLPALYIAAVLTAICFMVIAPFAEELLRTLRYRRQRRHDPT